jgi:hypothetical protein
MPVTHKQGTFVVKFTKAVFIHMTLKKRRPEDPPLVRKIQYPERVKWMAFIANCCSDVFNPFMPLKTGGRDIILLALGKAVREWLFNALDEFEYYSSPDERNDKVKVSLPTLSGLIKCRFNFWFLKTD